MVVNLTNDNFEAEVLNSNLPVLIDFWAEWCGPCKMMEPIIEEIANAYSDKVKIIKLNVDEVSTIASKYAIMSIPTFVLLKEGQEIARLSGDMPKDNLTKWIDSNLKA